LKQIKVVANCARTNCWQISVLTRSKSTSTAKNMYY